MIERFVDGRWYAFDLTAEVSRDDLVADGWALGPMGGVLDGHPRKARCSPNQESPSVACLELPSDIISPSLRQSWRWGEIGLANFIEISPDDVMEYYNGGPEEERGVLEANPALLAVDRAQVSRFMPPAAVGIGEVEEETASRSSTLTGFDRKLNTYTEEIAAALGLAVKHVHKSRVEKAREKIKGVFMAGFAEGSAELKNKKEE